MENVNNEIYDKYGDRWHTADNDPVALLRAESRAKTPWVLAQISENFAISPRTQVLDVGCGAGFLSNALASHGLHVTGVDLSSDSLLVAAKFDSTHSVQYLTADAGKLPFPDQSFDVITAMDFLEHVEDPQSIIIELSRVLRPGGLFIFHTFNRNLLSYLVIIKMVEWLVQNTPNNMHILRLFIKPQELQKFCIQADLVPQKMIGIKPVFSSIPLKNIFSGVVPPTMRFELTRNLWLSYMGSAMKSKNQT